jgi:hypothetical protein
MGDIARVRGEGRGGEGVGGFAGMQNAGEGVVEV